MDWQANNRMFSLLGQRGTFGTVLRELAAENPKIVALSADLTRTSGLERFSEDYKDRFMNVGIAEQNALGTAAGIADGGGVPFVTTFSNFATLRANEFVRHFMAYMKCNIKLVGFGSGFSMELFGNTHYGLEDIAVIRSMPNITILSPCDGMEVAKCVEYCAQSQGPVYLRLSGKMNNPIVNKADYQFKAGRGIVLREGQDALIYATGSMVNVAVKAAKKLNEYGIETSVINMHTIRPIDEELIIKNKDYPLIISIEEHARIGGLGSAIAEALSKENRHGRLISLGTGEEYLKAGTYEYMLEQHGLTTDHLVNVIRKECAE